jgi:hypothetical protein
MYSLMELLRFKKVLSLPYWIYIKIAFLITGVVMSGPTILSGLLIERQFEAAGSLLRLHKLFAVSASGLYGVLAVVYVMRLWGKKFRYQNEFILLGAIGGLVLITIVGALGGVIAFGLSLDPVTDFIYRLFFSK